MDKQWFYTSDGKTRLGPFSLDEMQAFARSGRLAPSHMAHQTGMPKWAVAATFPELFAPQPLPPEGKSGSQPEKSQLQAGALRVLSAIWSVPRATCSEGWRLANLLALRLRLRKLRRQEEQFLRQVGVDVLAPGAPVFGCQDFSDRFLRLSRSHQLAHQAGKEGDKNRRSEAARLAEQIQSLYIDVARHVLASRVPFKGRPRREEQWEQITASIVGVQQQVSDLEQQATAPPERRSRALIGLVASLALIALTCALVWRGRPAEDLPPQIAEVTPPREPIQEKKVEPVKPIKPVIPAKVPRTLKELFVHLAPAVPLVEAVDVGSGSGFLIKHGGKYLVVTNRHVVENARKGVAIHFILEAEGMKRFTIPADKTSVVAIHRSADLALIDVNKSAAEIDKQKIEPVTVAPASERPHEGEHVFAIGHPGGGEKVLTRTLSDGIVSAVGHKQEEARFLQVTVPINPGNSGGPLFNDEGRVVGVNTFGFRKSKGRDVVLEALNFSLEGEFVHALVNDPGKSLDAKAIAAVLRPADAEEPTALAAEAFRKERKFTAAGYTPIGGSSKASKKVFILMPGKRQAFWVRCRAGEYTAFAVSKGAEDIDLAVIESDGTVIASDVRVNTDPEVMFRLANPGRYAVVVVNPSKTAALVVMQLMEK